METIYIHGLEVSTLIGVYDWERTRQTTLLFDLAMDADLKAAMLSDDVADTIDYAKAAAFVQQVAAQCQFELLEALAHKVLDALFNAYPVQKVTLTITKPDILPDARAVAISFSRAR